MPIEVVQETFANQPANAAEAPVASSSARPAPSCCSCRNTRPTSIRSSRSSPSSSISYEKPQREPLKPFARKSAKSSALLPRTSVPTTSRIQAMHQRKIITLYGPSREVSAVPIAPSRSARSGRTRARTRTPISTPTRCCARPTAGREDVIVPSA
jgi:hypothetical protein